MIVSEPISHLRDKYSPLAVIVYGSYADGTNGDGSDFDALLIVPDGERTHDTSTVCGVQLDVFVYPANMIDDIDPYEIMQIHDGHVVADTDGIGAALCDKIREYVAAHPSKTSEELRDSLTWCKKMLSRAERADAEGAYRHHLVLVESLEIASDVCGRFYFGPKKTLEYLRSERPQMYSVYETALTCFNTESLCAWIDLLEAEVKTHLGVTWQRYT